MRLIDADELKERISRLLSIKSLDYLLPAEKAIVQQIDNAPTIDPERLEIIHCRDCIYLQSDEIFGAYWCRGRSVKPDHYCGYAVRRQDAAD